MGGYSCFGCDEACKGDRILKLARDRREDLSEGFHEVFACNLLKPDADATPPLAALAWLYSDPVGVEAYAR